MWCLNDTDDTMLSNSLKYIRKCELCNFENFGNLRDTVVSLRENAWIGGIQMWQCLLYPHLHHLTIEDTLQTSCANQFVYLALKNT